jgi:hypothetical protein
MHAHMHEAIAGDSNALRSPYGTSWECIGVERGEWSASAPYSAVIAPRRLGGSQGPSGRCGGPLA